MRIVYGVHGYGRGHAMRALAVLPDLQRRHDLLILAGGDAARALGDDDRVCQIPTLRYCHNAARRLSNRLTARRNVSAVLDLTLGGPALDMVTQIVREFGPQVVISDSEAYTHRAARVLGIPRIGFDHFGLLVYCRPEMSPVDRLICAGNAWVYRRLFGEPDRAVVVSFFDAPVRRAGVRIVGPVIRREVREAVPSQGTHLLVYLSMGDQEFTPRLRQALTAQSCPVLVYGTSRRDREGTVHYKPLDNRVFVEDLATCRAVMTTTGNQLMSEIIHLGKPMLGMPMACLEQRLNANQIPRLGIGRVVQRSRITPEVVREFLSQADNFARPARPETAWGETHAVRAIEQYAQELAGGQCLFQG